MPSITRVSSEAARASVDAVVGLLNVGGAGRIDIMDGSQPADVSIAITTQVVLATLTLDPVAFQAASDLGGFARASANAITGDTSADTSGTATWFRAYNGAGTAVIDGNVGLVDEAMILDRVAIVLNEIVTVVAWNFEQSET